MLFRLPQLRTAVARISGARRRGTAHGKRASRRLLLCGGTGALVLPLSLWLAVIFLPFAPEHLKPANPSSTLLDRRGKALRSYLSQDERWRIPARLGELSPWVVKATLAVEDKRFHSHSGIDWIAIVRAMSGNLRAGRIVSGASTITMQTAGLSDEPRRTWLRKLRQAFRALQLERAWSKRQILEFYLTHISYGGNVCGIEAASRRYFNKPARELSLSEAALLAGIPQSPTRLRPDRHYGAALKRRAHVLKRMLHNGDITRADYNRVLPQRPPVGQFDAPVEAPHFCDLVRGRSPIRETVRTSLDLKVQHAAENLLRARVEALRPRGVTNGAAVVLDNATGQVLALVGSVDYNAVADAGQVNGAWAGRSPGSTLKPLLYARAWDQGLLLPASILPDVPQPFARYSPENFDGSFQGLVRADKALAWSLNVPAVEVLRQLGVEETLPWLRRAGLVTLRRPSEEYGLSLAVGTCQVRLLDLTNACAMLARGGLWRPWSLTADGSDLPLGGREFRLLSEGSCFFVNRALSDPQLRPPAAIDPALAGMTGVAWKTGTSSGFRDAWTVAWDSQHCVGVWLGNMDGRSSRALAGAEAAAPVALGLMKHLRGARGEHWPRIPPDLCPVTVCRSTGLLPGNDCPSTASVEGLSPGNGRRMAATCRIHKRLLLDEETSTVLCTRCLGGRSRTEKVFALWPGATASWLSRTGETGETASPPPHFPGCLTRSPFSPPRITSPAPGDRFLVTGDRPLAFQKLALEATASPAGSQLYWFVDGRLSQIAKAGDVPAFVPLTEGAHTIRCVDQFGRSDSLTIRVDKE